MIDVDRLTIRLSRDERDILRGQQGPTRQKVLEAVARYGEAMRAPELVDIEGPGHFVIPWCLPGIAPPMEMLEELVAAGLKTKYPFTLDPRPPLDFENLSLRPEEEVAIEDLFRGQARYDELMLQLGLRDAEAYTCNPYQPEVGNAPERGTILAWSESACAVHANSALGARTNRNGAIIDLLSNIAGKTPLAGLLTDQGRRATWLVEVSTGSLPSPQLLGALIGQKVLAGVPYIVGLDRFLGSGLEATTIDYLHELGAGCATYGAVGLYHVEHVTPEAVEGGRQLLSEGFRVFVIDDQEVAHHFRAYPNAWNDPRARPEKCYIGCPHLSLRQLNWWAERIGQALRRRRLERVAVETILCAAPQVLREFRRASQGYQVLHNAGVRLSAACCETIFETGLCAGRPIVTNSNKLRAYTTARFVPDEELVEVLVSGTMGSWGST